MLCERRGEFVLCLAMFLLEKYDGAKEERVDEVEVYLCPQTTCLLQLVIHTLSGCELHLISSPQNLLLGEFLYMYLKHRIKEEV